MLVYAAVGDSLTVGVGAWPGAGLVPQYRALASRAANAYVESMSFGMSGATTGDILRLVKFNPRLRFILARADIITLTAGGNDLIRAAKQYARKQDPLVFPEALRECREHYAELVNTIRALKASRGSRYIIRAADLYNPYPAVPEAALWVKRFNRHIDSLQCGNFKIASVYSPFVGREKELLSVDGLHPNKQGYRVIAEQMSRLGYRPLL
ncbi:SGNH/GDSL hydrolase family protein [Paenibacillus allorhizosphaerae]|uniref:Spore germination lipase LipC n=1 Tax=Paenibacillus allorhizosphaerae TaxID=2849866 RepID=A0ABM8VKT8_9BACL|nr:SGNH/GDSL hydrolase family protein [Paenibacillus allorhizosphaerae]CAG7647516.1 Spore germination lipase LipC [Paenibacillus allorhizosphaerae]